MPPVFGQEAESERQYHQAAGAGFASQGQYHANPDASEARHQRGSSKRAGPPYAISRAAYSAVSIPRYAESANFSRLRRIGVSNCPRISISISGQNCSPKSAHIRARGRHQSRRIQYQAGGAARARPEGAEVRRDTRLMLQIGGLLGLAYGAFLALWLWATRLRPKVRRNARV
jgi:hypothetical protein